MGLSFERKVVVEESEITNYTEQGEKLNHNFGSEMSVRETRFDA